MHHDPVAVSLRRGAHDCSTRAGNEKKKKNVSHDNSKKYILVVPFNYAYSHTDSYATTITYMYGSIPVESIQHCL